MVAQVYPIKRLPRRFGFFDYAIPDGMNLRRGDLVAIPFRGQLIAGVVAQVKPESAAKYNLKTIERRLSETRPWSDQELGFFEALAFDLAQGVPAVLHAAWPRAATHASQPRAAGETPLTLRPKDAAALPQIIQTLAGGQRWFVQAPDLRRMAAIVAGYRRDHPEETLVVVTPNVRDAELCAQHLGIFRPWLISGQEKPSERAAVLAAFREQEHGILIGTRLAAVASHPKIDAIFVLRSGQENHKQADRNPRYDARRAAQLKAKIFGGRLVFMDVLPRPEEGQDFAGQILSFGQKGPLTVVDMKQERTAAVHPLLSVTTMSAIEKARAAGAPVLLVYNRKGVARRLRCADCQFTFPCPKCAGQLTIYEQQVRCPRCGMTRDLPLRCPKCGGPNLLQKGWGNRALLKILQKHFPQSQVTLLEKGMADPGGTEILLTTNHYLQNVFDPFTPANFGLVAMLDADLPLHHGHYRALENTLINLEEWRGLAEAARAEFLVQTDHAEILKAYQADPGKVMADELAARRAFDQPPQRRIVRISNKILPPEQALAALKNVADQAGLRIANLLTCGPQLDAKGTPTLELAVGPTEEATILSFLFEIDDSFVIDTDAIS